MRFLIDECTGPAVAEWLRSQDHAVYSVFDEERGITDDEILDKAVEEDWIVITNDKDFGEMVFREKRLHHGIVFLRLQDERAKSKIAALEKLLNLYQAQLLDSFVVVSESQVRFAET